MAEVREKTGRVHGSPGESPSSTAHVHMPKRRPASGTATGAKARTGAKSDAGVATDAKVKEASRHRGKQPARKRRRRFAMSSDERRHARRGRVLRIVACVVVLAICLFLALLVGNDEYRPTAVGWIPFIACVTAIVCAFLYLQVLKHSLKLLEKSEVTDCTRDEDVRFRVRFANRCPLFFFRIEAHFFTADLYGKPVSHRSTTMALAPFEKYDMPFTTRFEHIGTYQAGLDRVVVYDFLRLFSVTLEGPKRTRVQVVPKLVPVSDIPFSNDAVVETTKAARAALSDSMDYAAVRDYRWGDPLKNIHWKLSARTENYLTKLFETYTNPGVAVIMDFYGPAQGALDLMRLFDCVVETGFSVARYAQWRGMDAEVHYCDRVGEHVRRSTWRQDDLPQIVSDMPRFSNDPKRADDALELLEGQIRSIHGQSNVIVCTANLSARMVETVVEAKMHRREPLMFAVVPKGLEGRERDQWLSPLARLDAAGIGYRVLSSSNELSGVR